MMGLIRSIDTGKVWAAWILAPEKGNRVHATMASGHEYEQNMGQSYRLAGK